jgi:hypothetical protein
MMVVYLVIATRFAVGISFAVLRVLWIQRITFKQFKYDH